MVKKYCSGDFVKDNNDGLVIRIIYSLRFRTSLAPCADVSSDLCGESRFMLQSEIMELILLAR